MPHCPLCGNEISRQTTEQILQHVMALRPDDRIMVMAPVVRGRKGEYKKELEKFARLGFERVRIDGVLYTLDERMPALDKRKNHTIEVVVDRLLVKTGIQDRLQKSIDVATKLADGLVLISIVNGDERLYSQKLACTECGTSIPSLEPRSFSFNSPYGACEECHGLGSIWTFDPVKMIVDPSKPLFDGGLGSGEQVRTGPWNSERGGRGAENGVASASLTKPFEELSEAKAQDTLMEGGSSAGRTAGRSRQRGRRYLSRSGSPITCRQSSSARRAWAEAAAREALQPCWCA